MFAITKRPTITEIHALYARGDVKPSQVAQFFLNRSKKIDKKVHAVLRFTDDLAMEQCQLLDKLLAEYKYNYTSELHNEKKWFEKLVEKYPLFGVPYSLKDNIVVEGQIATSASRILDGFIAPYSATVYSKIKEAGGILISQSNLDEWAVGSSTEHSAYGMTHNPFDVSRVPGGSSGGPAAVVGAGEVVFSLGSDTGGSVRVPAAFCDVVGLKPTYGLISRYGVMPLSSSLDQIGPIANTINDVRIITQVLAGKDYQDQTSLHHTMPDSSEQFKEQFVRVSTKKSLEKYIIGIPNEYFEDGIEEQIRQRVVEVISHLTKLGHTIKEVSLPLTKYGLAVYYTTMTVETAANLQRYDGIRYGYQFGSEDGLCYGARRENLGEETKRRIMLGTFASSSGYYDAYYNRACQIRQLMTKDFENVFKEVDVLLTPTSPEFAFKKGSKVNDPIKMYLSDILVYGANLAKIPAIHIPVGFCAVKDADTQEYVMLPTGCQIMGPELSESKLFDLGLDIESSIAKLK